MKQAYLPAVTCVLLKAYLKDKKIQLEIDASRAKPTLIGSQH